MSYQRIRQELTDFATYFLMPLPALLLPWRIAYRWYYYLAGKPWLFEQRVQAACHNAQRLLTIEDMVSWKRHHRLTLIIDHTDFWISWLQPGRAKRLLQTTGKWPEHGPFIVVGTHYGCGFMLMRALQRAGVEPYFIIRKTPKSMFCDQRVRQIYVYLRLRHQKILFPGKCYHPESYPRRLIRGLDQGDNILVLLDVPAERNRNSQNISLFKHVGKVQRGMFDLLIRKQLHYVTYKTHIDFTIGQRQLFIHRAKRVNTDSEFWSDMDQYINTTFSSDSSQWHLWQVASLYFLPAVDNKNNISITKESALPLYNSNPSQGRSPDFLIIGAQKCGTSWLHHNLRNHKYLYMPDNKDTEIYLNSEKDKAKLFLRMAKAGNNQICGDSNAAFFWTPNTPLGAPLFNSDIASATRHYLDNNLKVIVLLRDPLQRTISAYLHHIGMRTLNPNTRLFDAPDKLGLVAHSQYGSNLQHWRKYYPDEQILVLPSPENNNHLQVYTRCLDFLKVNPAPINNQINLPVFQGLSRIIDGEGVWVNLSHPVFSSTPFDTSIKIREVQNQNYALLISNSDLDRLTTLLSEDTMQLQQQLPDTWMHTEFQRWSTWSQ